jgi:hypothetical protein
MLFALRVRSKTLSVVIYYGISAPTTTLQFLLKTKYIHVQHEIIFHYP